MYNREISEDGPLNQTETCRRINQ